MESKEELKKRLNRLAFHVTQQKGTQRPFTSELLNIHQTGIFHCVVCNQQLFHSDTKFNSGTGWPSFYQPITPQSLQQNRDTSHGMVRVEVVCARCKAHLGHVFNDGPGPTGMRYCINGVSLNFNTN